MELTRRSLIGALALLATTLDAGVSAAEQGRDRYITVASTTSTENSGLFAHLLPIFAAKSGIRVHVVALGTGQALDVARRGDADVVFVHDPTAERKFIEQGFGVGRRDVMYNDFVLIGPKSDPAGVAGKDITEALRAIATAEAPFVSRGDRSGTHTAELRLWADASIDIEQTKGRWYRETGAGMGGSLNTAAAMDAYLISDRGTWLAFRNRRELDVLVEGDERLFNQYGVMLVNPARHPQVKREDAQTFIDWIVSEQGQAAIADFRIDGKQAFFPNARPTGGPGND